MSQEPRRGLFILVKGKMNLTRHSQGVEIPIGQHEAPSFFGEIPVLTDEPVPVTTLLILAVEFHLKFKRAFLNPSSPLNQWDVVQDLVWKPFAGL